MFTQLCEVTTNMPYILSVVREKWGPDYVLVTADGLQIEDSDGTRGTLLDAIFIATCVCKYLKTSISIVMYQLRMSWV